MPRAFVIRPFGTKTDSSGREIDFDAVHEALIGPAIAGADLDGDTTGEIIDSGNIREDMFALILEADLVIADITVHNANVFYELGIRHALRKGRTLLIKGDTTSDETPFDLLTDRYLLYSVSDPAAAGAELLAMVRASLRSDRETDSPVFQMLPTLPESDPSQVAVIPVDFGEEVARARAARSAGWLRLLAGELSGTRFEVDGTRLVARAQFALRDYAGARSSWELVRDWRREDVEANLALANIFERLYREEHKPELLEGSDQAITRALAGSISRTDRAEALSLRGRNLKTRWRLEFDDIEELDARRDAAMSRALIESFEAYREAFFVDLNHFYPGLNALQSGTMLLDLSSRASWPDAFDTDEEADRYRSELAGSVADLRSIVSTSVDNAIGEADRRGEPDIWAEISKADVLFLAESPRARRVVKAYEHAIPLDDPFAWDAARGQLELFAGLGIRADLVGEVVDAVGGRVGPGTESATKPVHLIVFAGHRIDDTDREAPRFPTTAEAQAKALIRAAIEELLDDEWSFQALASVSPGADILAHEVFAELGVPCTVALPMPRNDFASEQFEGLDDWRTRYLDLTERSRVVELSDRAGLPRWLEGSGIDAWDRGNRWVMQLALTSGARRITLVALWDGDDDGSVGGTAQMVRLAREAGEVRIVHVDSGLLLAPELQR